MNNPKPCPTAVKVMTALAMLAEVEKSLRFLAAVGVVKSESIVKGCRKFVRDHPEIQAWIDRESFADNEGSNASFSRGAEAAGRSESAASES